MSHQKKDWLDRAREPSQLGIREYALTLGVVLLATAALICVGLYFVSPF